MNAEAQHEPQETYDGPADVGGVTVEVRLRGRFEPIDGRFHWYGRVGSDATLAARHASGDTVSLSTPHGQAEGRLSEPDPWGRYRIAGTGRPPF